jgi:hypothetical protein
MCEGFELNLSTGELRLFGMGSKREVASVGVASFGVASVTPPPSLPPKVASVDGRSLYALIFNSIRKNQSCYFLGFLLPAHQMVLLKNLNVEINNTCFNF